jgi:serine/threonine-protein kinase
MDCPACHHPNADGARFCAKCGAPLPAPASTVDPLIGTVVGGRFRVTGVLGEGGMGRVYTAEQQMGTHVRKVAVKTLLAQFAKDPQTVARFMREVGTVSALEHPNTIQIFDFGQTDGGELYIAMELLQGKSLETVLEEGGPLQPERVDRILGQVCGSLQEAHDKGIVHRDLKPANIFLATRAGEDDYVKVLDFGIAKRAESKDSKAEAKLTQQGTILGTPPYMSPEQFTGKELDGRSDVYSLGVVAYEMLVGRLPFDADTPWQWATQHMTAQPFPFETQPIAASVPAKMKNAIMRALGKDRAQRQSTVREFFEELTLGTTRVSMLGGMQGAGGTFPGSTAGVSAPGVSSGPRPGNTQVGEPLFVGGAPTPGAGAGASHTLIEVPPATEPAGARPPVPTGGGQVYPAPTPGGGAQKSNTGLIAGIGAVVAVAAIAIGVVVMKGRSGGATEIEAIALPSAPSVTLSSETPPVATSAPEVVVDAGAAAADAKPKNPTGAGSAAAGSSGSSSSSSSSTGGGSQVDAQGAADCEAAVNLARGNNTMLAINRFRTCKGPKQSEARAAIDAAALRDVKKSGCSAKGIADAAAAIGAPSGRGALPASCGGKKR